MWLVKGESEGEAGRAGESRSSSMMTSVGQAIPIQRQRSCQEAHTA